MAAPVQRLLHSPRADRPLARPRRHVGAGLRTKPFGVRELNAGLRVALRHHTAAEPEESAARLQVGRLSLDLGHYQASLSGKELELTPREFDFLGCLARHAGKVCTRQMILQNVWSPGYRLVPPGDGD